MHHSPVSPMARASSEKPLPGRPRSNTAPSKTVLAELPGSLLLENQGFPIPMQEKLDLPDSRKPSQLQAIASLNLDERNRDGPEKTRPQPMRHRKSASECTFFRTDSVVQQNRFDPSFTYGACDSSKRRSEQQRVVERAKAERSRRTWLPNRTSIFDLTENEGSGSSSTGTVSASQDKRERNSSQRSFRSSVTAADVRIRLQLAHDDSVGSVNGTDEATRRTSQATAHGLLPAVSQSTDLSRSPAANSSEDRNYVLNGHSTALGAITSDCLLFNNDQRKPDLLPKPRMIAELDAQPNAMVVSESLPCRQKAVHGRHSTASASMSGSTSAHGRLSKHCLTPLSPTAEFDENSTAKEDARVSLSSTAQQERPVSRLRLEELERLNGLPNGQLARNGMTEAGMIETVEDLQIRLHVSEAQRLELAKENRGLQQYLNASTQNEKGLIVATASKDCAKCAATVQRVLPSTQDANRAHLLAPRHLEAAQKRTRTSLEAVNDSVASRRTQLLEFELDAYINQLQASAESPAPHTGTFSTTTLTRTRAASLNHESGAFSPNRDVVISESRRLRRTIRELQNVITGLRAQRDQMASLLRAEIEINTEYRHGYSTAPPTSGHSASDETSRADDGSPSLPHLRSLSVDSRPKRRADTPCHAEESDQTPVALFRDGPFHEFDFEQRKNAENLDNHDQITPESPHTVVQQDQTIAGEACMRPKLVEIKSPNQNVKRPAPPPPQVHGLHSGKDNELKVGSPSKGRPSPILAWLPTTSMPTTPPTSPTPRSPPIRDKTLPPLPMTPPPSYSAKSSRQHSLSGAVEFSTFVLNNSRSLSDSVIPPHREADDIRMEETSPLRLKKSMSRQKTDGDDGPVSVTANSRDAGQGHSLGTTSTTKSRYNPNLRLPWKMKSTAVLVREKSKSNVAITVPMTT